MQVVILSTRQNFSWISMQEILPALEHAWQEAAGQCGHDVIMINVDEKSPKSFARELILADHIVVTAFNTSIANYLLFLRKGLGNACPWSFYLHGLATIALWPALMMGLKNYFYKHDTFIGTCQGDQACLDHIFENPHYEQLPFHLLPLDEVEYQLETGEINFHYMGRISPQKNLISLVHGFAYLVKKYPEAVLHFFGEEDHLGHPNMGIQCKDYKQQIVDEIQKLGLEKKVYLHGFIEREKIQYLLNNLDPKKNFFVSVSNHSDENFGMAALRALCAGWKCLLSDWGGHKNYFKYFPKQSMKLLSSLEKGKRPTINPLLMGEKMQMVVEMPYFVDELKGFDLESSIIEAKRLFAKLDFDDGPLNLKKETELLLERKKSWPKDAQKIFEGYHDPYAYLFLAAYMKDSTTEP